MKYLIIKCIPLSDQYECDADREPVCITNDTTAYEGKSYDIYEIHNDGSLELIQSYENCE